MSRTPSNLIPIRNAIYAQLVAELAPSKRINGVQAVGYAWLNATKLFPYISIYAAGRDNEISAVRQKRNTLHYVIGLAVRSNVSLEDAYTQLYTFLDDGNGIQYQVTQVTVYPWLKKLHLHRTVAGT